MAPGKTKITSFLDCPVGKLNLDSGLNLIETRKNERFFRCPRRENAGQEVVHRVQTGEVGYKF